jgi:uncharacterized membrane protein
VITLEFIYWLMGAMLAGVAVVSARDATNPRRWSNAAFWGLWAVSFVLGSHVSDLANGALALGMVAVGGVGRLGRGRDDSALPEQRARRDASARRWRNWLFVPALTIPAVTLAGTFLLKSATLGGRPLVDPKQVTLVSLGVATVVALAVGMAMLRPPPATPVREAARLMDAVGWAAVLPQMLAALGAVFAAAGVGTVVASIAQRWIPLGTAGAAVATYTIGMALFTIVMGNAFAAFPVMTAGIGLPLVVQRFGGDVTVVAAVGMLSGFCGTLMTPMAANFNIVPAALLELPDQNAVIKAQVPTGLLLLAVNTVLMYTLAFRR